MTEESLLERIVTAEKLPSPPAVAIEVLRLLRSDDVSIKQIAAVVHQDPAMTGKLLKLVNSSLFNRGRKIGSLDQALVLLGLRTVKVSLLGFSFSSSLQRPDDHGFDYPRYWRGSLCMAIAARMIAEHLAKARQDEAFVAGLLADVGQIAAHQAMPDRYDPVRKRAVSGDKPLHEVEAAALGFSHDVISGALLKRWGLPDEISEAVIGHHGPEQPSGQASGLSTVLRLAAMTAASMDGSEPGAVPAIEAMLAARLRISTPDAQQLVEGILEHLPQTAEAFGLTIADVKTYAELQAEAAARLAQYGLAAEAERTQAQQQAAQATACLDRIEQEIHVLRRDASRDGLTGIANRAAFEKFLRQAWDSSMQSGAPLSIMMFDLDHFKQLNDAYGHPAGDETLRKVGQLLKSLDDESCFAARYGGEEFVVVVRSKDHKRVCELAERIRRQMAGSPVEYRGQRIPFTASVGVAHMRMASNGATVNDLVARADGLLYEAKRSGRDCVVFGEGCSVPTP